MPLKENLAKAYKGEWQVNLFQAPCAKPLPFCVGCICPQCYSCKQRFEILDFIGEEYVCCGGICPCGPLGEPMDRNCMFLEGCCCVSCAIGGNRFLIQTRFDVQNDCFDECLLWATCILSWVNACCDLPEELEFAIDCLQMIVAGCELAQHDHQMEYQQAKGYQGPSQEIMANLPVSQQEMINRAKQGGYRQGGACPPMAAQVGASHFH